MNDLLEELKLCKTDEEIRALVDYYKEEYIKESKEFNDEMVLGRDLPINPQYQLNVGGMGPHVNNRWVGYIPKDVKIVYKCVRDENAAFNDGGYYYMGDEDYLYEFAYFIKDRTVKDEITFILLVDKFIHQYFDKGLNPSDRERVHSLLLDKEGNRIPPRKEHYLSDFKGNGAAKCSEFAVLAQNLMTIFGLETEVIFDTSHAYNMYFETDGDANVLDFSNRVCMYDINLNFLRMVPFLEPIEGFNDDIYDEFLYSDRKFRFDNYYVIDGYKTNIIVTTDQVRAYGTDGKLVYKSTGEPVIKLSKKKE